MNQLNKLIKPHLLRRERPTPRPNLYLTLTPLAVHTVAPADPIPNQDDVETPSPA